MVAALPRRASLLWCSAAARPLTDRYRLVLMREMRRAPQSNLPRRGNR
jgi:hypothetical protein